jgi:hypothetical protein
MAAWLLEGSVRGAELANRQVFRAGDHVAIVGGTFADQMRNCGYTKTRILQSHRGYDLSFRNLGWPGDTLSVRGRPTNFPTEDETLAAHKTDVILAFYGSGESFAGEAGLADFRRKLQTQVDHFSRQRFNGRAAPRVILISPNACEDHGERTPDVESRNRDLAAYSNVIREIASANDLEFVDLYAATQKLMNNPGASKLTVNGVMLSRYGYWAVSQILASALGREARSWRVRIDAASGEAIGRGIQLSQFAARADGFECQAQELDWPGLAPPEGSRPHPALAGVDGRVTIAHLKPGNYALKIGGRLAAKASHQEWARGVAVRVEASHQRIENYLKAVNDKNAHFYYSWKALNQVHIVGERRKSASGRSLPAEVVEFSRMAERKDKELTRLGEPQSDRVWRLTRVSRP